MAHILIIVDLLKKKALWGNLKRSDFKDRPYLHVGAQKKVLTVYKPNAFRNRLLEPSIVMPGPNVSQIVIGDAL